VSGAPRAPTGGSRLFFVYEERRFCTHEIQRVDLVCFFRVRKTGADFEWPNAEQSLNPSNTGRALLLASTRSCRILAGPKRRFLMADSAASTHGVELDECECASVAPASSASTTSPSRPSNDLLALDVGAPPGPGARGPERTSTNAHHSVASDNPAPPLALDALDSDVLRIVVMNVDFAFLMKSVCKPFLAAVGTGTATKTSEVLALGSPSVLKWAQNSGCVWDEKTCARVAARGDLVTLQRARALGCPWNERTCALAAKGGHLAVLQWARAQGCPWDRQVADYAVEWNRDEVMEWSLHNGCEVIKMRTEMFVDTQGNRRFRPITVKEVFEGDVKRVYRWRSGVEGHGFVLVS